MCIYVCAFKFKNTPWLSCLILCNSFHLEIPFSCCYKVKRLFSQAVVPFNPSTQETQARGSLSLRSDWFQDNQATQRKSISKHQKEKNNLSMYTLVNWSPYPEQLQSKEDMNSWLSVPCSHMRILAISIQPHKSTKGQGCRPEWSFLEISLAYFPFPVSPFDLSFIILRLKPSEACA